MKRKRDQRLTKTIRMRSSCFDTHLKSLEGDEAGLKNLRSSLGWTNLILDRVDMVTESLTMLKFLLLQSPIPTAPAAPPAGRAMDGICRSRSLQDIVESCRVQDSRLSHFFYRSFVKHVYNVPKQPPAHYVSREDFALAYDRIFSSKPTAGYTAHKNAL